ncbi:MAG: PAS domain-containing protein [Alphaproteobacteria bacterium]|nr:PAS domain-containing protein [Alphaproteobacteria bacterium]
MRTTTNANLYAYWNDVRGTRAAPRRFEIEPSRIADILSDTFILEFQEPSSFIYRLAGTRICDTLGEERRGRNFLDDWQTSDRFSVQRHLTSVRKLGAVATILVDGATQAGRLARFEVLIMPLLHNGETIDRFLGGFVTVNPQSWFGCEPIASFKTIETELTYPSDGLELAEPALRISLTDPAPPPVLPNVRSARIVRQDKRQFRVYEGGLSRRGDEST